MSHFRNKLCCLFRRTLPLVSLMLVLALSTAGVVDAGLRTVHFENGFRLTLVPSAGSGMTASVVVVPCGVRDETASLNGAAHMMEHLMFNGTTKRNQKELYEAIDSLGAYVNAATREDHTCFLTLAPAENFAASSRLQAEMLLESTLLKAKLEKERGIVLQELAKDKQRPSYTDNGRHRRNLFGKLPYARPTLGNPITIRAMPRAALLNYYKRLYRPSRLKAYVFGQFDEKAVLDLYKELYGKIDSSRRQSSELKITKSQVFSSEPRIKHFVARSPSSKIYLTYPLDMPPAASWVAAKVLAARLGQGIDSPLRRWAKKIGATGVSASTRFNRDLAFFDVVATLPTGANLDEILLSLRKFLAVEGARSPSIGWLKRHSRRVSADDRFLSENMHYYAFMRASTLANTSLEDMETERQAMMLLKPKDLVLAAKQIFSSSYVATLLRSRPRPKKIVSGGMRKGMSKGMSKGMGAGHASPMMRMAGGAQKIKLKKRPGLSKSAVDKESSSKGYGGEVAIEHLANGMEVVLVSAEGPPILAVHVLLKGRSGIETRPGALAIAHRCMARRCKDLSSEGLQRRLDELGARLKFHDDSNIPFDNYYSVPDFAYLRFEALDEYAPEALNLLARLIFSPDFHSDDLDEVRKELSHGRHGRGLSASSRARRHLAQALYGNGEMTASVLPDSATLRSLTVDDLRRSHKAAYVGQRLVMTVIGSRPLVELKRLVRKSFGAVSCEKGSAWKMPRFKKTTKFKRIEERVKKGERGLVAMARLFDCSPDERGALLVLASVLSERIAFEIRERRGLAYGVGCSARYLWGQAVLSLRFGTRPDAVEVATKVVKEIIEKIAAGDIDEQSCRRGANKLLGRRRMRLLPRVNRAFRMGWNRHHGLSALAHAEVDRHLMTVGTAEVSALASRLLSGPWLEAVAY